MNMAYLEDVSKRNYKTNDSNSHNDSQTPDIDHVIMALLALFQDLRCDVVWCSAKGRSADSVHITSCNQKSRETKVTNLGIHLRVEEDVAHLQISVDDALAMHVLDCASDLNRVEANLGFGEAFSSLHHIHEGAVGAELEGQVCRLVEGEGSEELHNVLVVHLGMDLKLGLELHHVSTGRPLQPSLSLPFVPSWEACDS